MMRTTCASAGRGPRVLALTAVAVGAAAAAVVLAVPPLVSFRAELGGTAVPPLQEWVAAGSGAALVLCAAWLALIGLACALEAATGGAPGPLTRVVPFVVRRTVLLGCGVAVGTASVTVPASSHEKARVPVSPPPAHALVGLPLPDRQPGAAPATYTVRPGDSLWSVAAARLPHGSAEHVIDATWRRLYAVNRGVIGEDPDLLLPGATLLLPSDHPSAG